MKRTLRMMTAFMAAATVAGCTAPSSDDAASVSTLLSLSGTLSTAQSQAMKLSSVSTMAAVSVADLEIYAIAFTSPPVIAEADVNSDGSFVVNLPGAKGSAVTAIFRDKTDNSQVGTIVFEDSSSKDLNGNASQSSSIVLKDSVSLGSITLGTDGKVKIPVSQIASVVGSAPAAGSGTAFDPTGVWYMKAYDGTLPTGYQTITSDCSHGPCIGFPMTLVRLTGKKFTPVSNCDHSASPVVCAEADGTVGSEDRYAMSLWGDTFANGIGACGSKIGFSADEARSGGGIHVTTLPSVSGNSISFGDYGYTVPSGFGGDAAPFNLPWMKTAATTTHDIHDCRPMSVSHNSNSFRGWACKSEVMDTSGGYPGTGTGSFGWSVGVEGGGCFNTATNKPVHVKNWGAIGYGDCSMTDTSSTYGTGFNTNTCVYQSADHDGDAATAAINLSCTHTGGNFTDSSGPTTTPLTLAMNRHMGAPEPLAVAGATCASIGSATTAAKLAAYRCYAQAYWQANTSGACKREYNFNWAATSAEDFAQDNHRGKPENAFITNIVTYSADGKTATLEDEEVEKFALSTGLNSSTFCEASRRTVINFKKQSDSRMLVDLKQSGQMNSTEAACQGAAKDAKAGKEVPGSGDLEHMLSSDNIMFYLDSSQ